jgi:hypothetical protein
MTFRSISQLVCASFLFATFAPAPATAGTAVSCNPAPARLKALVGSAFVADTNSATFVNLGQTRVLFTQATAGCVIVRFSAEASTTGSGMLVRAILDSVDVALPAQVHFAVNDGSPGVARSYEFIFPNVAPGTHEVRMQFHSGDGASTVFVNNRTITVLYK